MSDVYARREGRHIVPYGPTALDGRVERQERDHHLWQA